MSTSSTHELEIKLRFDGAAEARAAIAATGATPLRNRRLQKDALFDTPNGQLRARRSLLRVRQEGGAARLTFKGPPQPSMMKLREELETEIGDGWLLEEMLERIGLVVWFRYEKYREEFSLAGTIVAIDETPIGTFVEIEGAHDGIIAAADALGRAPIDYVLDSYRNLFMQHCQARGLPMTDMVFPRE
jgi:adenylate cyclase, class 2